MDTVIQHEPAMDTPATYQIKVRGILTEQWSDWFNGSIFTIEHSLQSSPRTILTCIVKDQSELFGILTKLNNLNLPLLHVMLVNVQSGGNTQRRYACSSCNGISFTKK